MKIDEIDLDRSKEIQYVMSELTPVYYHFQYSKWTDFIGCTHKQSAQLLIKLKKRILCKNLGFVEVTQFFYVQRGFVSLWKERQ